jgi:hypothetical protein
LILDGLPVMDDGEHVVGMITETGLLAAFVEMLHGARPLGPARHARMKRARRSAKRAAAAQRFGKG